MIVKDETPVLDRLFNSVKNHIDYWVIVDTGSTDGTQEFIRDYFRNAGVPGELHERPWINFGHNRQQALELAMAARQGGWLLFIDADEELVVNDPAVLGSLEPGTSYRVEKRHGNIHYRLSALVNIESSAWRWRAPVHEYLEQVSGPENLRFLDGVFIRYHQGEGARSTSTSPEGKFLGDARILEDYLKKHPGDARSQFYLANSWKDAGHDEKAFAAYEQRCSMAGWEEEDFLARLQLGRMAIRLQKREDKILEILLDAFEKRPTRAEPLYELARYYRTREQYARGFIYAASGSQIPQPDDILFVENTVYSWQILDELGVCAYWVGAYQVSLQACQTIIDRVARGLSVPDADIDRIHQNIAFANVKLGELAN